METADGKARNFARWMTLFLWTVVCLFFACGCSEVVASEQGVLTEETVKVDVRKTQEIPEVDPAAVPIPSDSESVLLGYSGERTAVLQAAIPIPEPEAVERIRFQPIFDIDIRETDGTGSLYYSNSGASTVDVVLLLCISDAELMEAGYDPIVCGVRTAEEMNCSDYCAEKAYTVLFRSEKLSAGEQLDGCELAVLPNGMLLGAGDYRMTLRVDAFIPLTGEKAAVCAANETVVHIHA